jgi:hypothetical protein
MTAEGWTGKDTEGSGGGLRYLGTTMVPTETGQDTGQLSLNSDMKP